MIKRTADMRRIILLVCMWILMISCSENSIDKILDRAENIVVSYPDSALMLLDSIINPYLPTKEQQAQRTILTLYARDLMDKDISKDTMIIYARDYLEKANNPKYLALAEYYLGRICQAQGRNDQALQFYLNAETNAGKTDNSDIKSLIVSNIGQQYCNRRKYNEAIEYFKSALEYFNKSKDNYKRKIAVLNKINVPERR
jgi:tetratricopeptide (TPR) repeat protein